MRSAALALLLLGAAQGLRSAGVAPRREVDPALDCGLRAVAYNFSQHLFPTDPTSWALVFDALRLGSECGQQRPAAPARAPPRTPALAPAAGPTYYVSPAGDDASGDGSLARPFASPARALEAARSGAGGGGAPTVLLREGTYYLPAPLVLTAVDSGLTLAGYPGERAVLSGAQPLPPLAWSFYAALPSGGMSGPTAGLSCVSNAPGLTPGGNASGIVYAGDYATPQACEAACAGAPACTAYTYHDSTVTDGWATQCYFRTDGQYSPTSPWPGHYAGAKLPGQNASIWRAALPPGVAPDFLNLYDAARGRRLTRARSPNGNPEETIDGFAAGATAWLPPARFPDPEEVHIASPARDADPFFATYQLGLGGTCAIFEPAQGFWCTKSPPAGAQFNVPSGVQLPPGAAMLAGNWSDAAGAVFHAFHGERWGDWKFQVATGNASSGLLQWSYGGFQENRGSASGDTFMIENLLGLLDEHEEWYVDSAAGALYLAVNNSAPAPPPLLATRLDSLLRLEGSSDAPVVGVTVAGLEFAHTAPTFMKPYAMAGGGDWSTRVDGAVWLEGTEGAALSGCTFEGLGGNGVFLHGYNRRAAVTGGRFRFIGDSAIVSLGKVAGMDGSAQEAPFGTVVAGNIASELGLYTKQSGFYYAGLSGNATVQGNACFNTPRACININDGYAGGHLIRGNLGFNAVRETSDHGSFNSWDRQPYIWNPDDLNNLYPAQTTITQNVFINNYHSTWPIDHDDGSNNYLDTYNLLIWGGGKNYLGFNKAFEGNMYLFPEANEPTVSGSAVGTGFSPYCYGSQGSAALPPSLRDSWVGETCLTTAPGASGTLYSIGGCNAAAPLDGHAPLLANNTLYSADAGYALACGGQTWGLAQAQAHGLDVGTVLLATPSTADVLALVNAFVAAHLLE